MPAPTCLMSPARTMSWWEVASASAGGSFSVGRKYRVSRVTTASLEAGYPGQPPGKRRNRPLWPLFNP
jgi:hypothetical protein